MPHFHVGADIGMSACKALLLRAESGLELRLFVGGGTLSPTWLGIVADVLGMDGEVPASADASLGAAMLAGVGAGLLGSLEEGLGRCYRVRARVDHSAANTRVYEGVFERYLATRPARGSVS